MFRIWSGGQTGVDQAAWRAARAVGWPTAGFMPRGFRTEEGPRPEFADLYGAKELMMWSQTAQLRLNLVNADLVVMVTLPDTIMLEVIAKEATDLNRPIFETSVSRTLAIDAPAAGLTAWLRCNGGRSPTNVLVVGNQESTLPGIGEAAEAWLVEAFRLAGGAE